MNAHNSSSNRGLSLPEIDWNNRYSLVPPLLHGCDNEEGERKGGDQIRARRCLVEPLHGAQGTDQLRGPHCHEG